MGTKTRQQQQQRVQARQRVVEATHQEASSRWSSYAYDQDVSSSEALAPPRLSNKGKGRAAATNTRGAGSLFYVVVLFTTFFVVIGGTSRGVHALAVPSAASRKAILAAAGLSEPVFVRKQQSSEQHLQSRRQPLARRHQSVMKVRESTAQQEVTPTARWGHTSAYLPQANVVVFVGGRSALDGSLTNDVYALDLSAAAATNSSMTNSSTTAWTKLDSGALEPHAFAASTVTSNDDDDNGERLYIIGGERDSCVGTFDSAPASFVWSPTQAGASWQNATWDQIVAQETSPAASRMGMRAVQVSPGLGLNASTQQSVGGAGDGLMVLGGASTACGEDAGSLYEGLDMMTVSQTQPSKGSMAWFKSFMWTQPRQATVTDTRSLALSTSTFADMPLADYTSVVVPSNGTSTLVLIGGLDADDKLAPMDSLWTLDLQSGVWSMMNASAGDVPSGRIGMASALTSDGKILIHGGYTSTKSGANPTSDVYTLDTTTQPAATWVKMEGGNSPAKAYHSAVVAGDVVVFGFGQGSSSTSSASQFSSSSSSSSSVAADENDEAGSIVDDDGPVHYLDTGHPDGWMWSNSVQGVAAARVDPAAASSTGAAASSLMQPAPVPVSTSASTTDSSDASASSNVASSTDSDSSDDGGDDSTDAAPSDTTDSDDSDSSDADADSDTGAKSSSNKDSDSDSDSASGSKTDKSSKKNSDSKDNDQSNKGNSKAAKASSSKDKDSKSTPSSTPAAASASASSDGDNDSTTTPPVTSKQRTAAVVGSVLGATALAAAVGGLYAYHKRRQAARREDEAHDFDTIDGEKWASKPLTPQQYYDAAGEGALGAAAAGGGMAGFVKRSASKLWTSSKPIATTDRYSSPEQSGFYVVRNAAPNARSRLSMRRASMAPAVINAKQQQTGQQEQGALPDAFLDSLLDDDDRRAHYDIGRTVGGGIVTMPARAHLKGGAGSNASSSDADEIDLNEEDGASHFSYPYLGAMHRTSMANMNPHAAAAAAVTTSPTSSNEMGEGNAAVVSPRDAMRRAKLADQQQQLSPVNNSKPYRNAAMAPQWSPDEAEAMHAIFVQSVRRSPDAEHHIDSPGQAEEEDEEEERTNVAQRFVTPRIPSGALGGGAGGAFASSPMLFPWSPRPDEQQSSKRPMEARKLSERRAQRTDLHVTN